MSLAERLRLLIEHLGISHQKFASRLDVSRAMISRLLSGQRGKRPEAFIWRVERLLGVSKDYWSADDPIAFLRAAGAGGQEAAPMLRASSAKFEPVVRAFAFLYELRASGVGASWLSDCIARCERELGGSS